MASLEKIYSILGFVLAADKFTLSIYFLTFQLLFHWIHLVMFFHLVIFNTLQGRHHLEMWRGRCGGWEFFLQVFFGHNPIMQDIFRCWIFFPVSFAIQDFLFCRIFLTFQLLFHWIHLVMFFHLVIFNTLQGRHHLEMWRGRCGGWEFFLQVFFGHNPIMQDIFRCWIFFPVSFAIQDFLFCRIFPFYLFFCHPPSPSNAR